jgi:hypothetical protein
MTIYSMKQAMEAARAWGHTPLSELPLLTEEAKMLGWWALSRKAAPSKGEQQEVLSYAADLWSSSKEEARERVKALVPSSISEGKLRLMASDKEDHWKSALFDLLAGDAGFGKVGYLGYRELRFVQGPALSQALSFLKVEYDRHPLRSVRTFRDWCGYINRPCFEGPNEWGRGLHSLFQHNIVHEPELLKSIRDEMLVNATIAVWYNKLGWELPEGQVSY